MPHVRWLLGCCWLLLVGALAPAPVAAQEFDCAVSVNISQLTGSEYTFLNELGERVDEYLNDHFWTEDTFREHERINCTFQITLEEALSLTSFRGRLVLATRRPIYGTTQYTTVVQFNDADWQFNYAQGTPLIHNEDQFDPLTSVLDFYAYIMLGYDYDTFSEFGGTPHFQKARAIAQRAESRGASGWSQIGAEQSRVQLINQLVDPRFQKLRKAYFDYHFAGLDHFVQQTEEARNNVLAVILAMDELYDELSRTYAADLFFSAKYRELASIFEDSPMSSQAYEMLSEIDPAHMSEYNRLTQ